MGDTTAGGAERLDGRDARGPDERAGAERDPRVRRTRRDLRAALLDLADHRPLDDISVSEIALAAGVNRATFYLHYRDREGLLLDAVEALMAQTAEGTATATEQEVADPDHPPRHTLEFFAALDAHAALYRRILGPNGSAAVITRMRDRLREAVAVELERRAPEGSHERIGVETHAAFLAGAIVGVAAQWLQDEPRAPMEEVAAATWALAVTTRADR